MALNMSEIFTPTPRQQEAYDLIGKGGIIAYGGARGGGKSVFALWGSVFSCLQHPYLRATIVRETYQQLEDNFVSKFLDKCPSSLYQYSSKEKTVKFYNNARLSFRALETPEDAKKIHGIETQLLTFDEANNFDIETIKRAMGSLRISKADNQNFLPTLIMTFNPGGYNDDWFLSHFVQVDYSKWTKEELKAKDKYIFIPAKVSDNPYVGEEYISWLESLPPHLKMAWLEGRFGVFAGQFFEMWDDEMHTVPDFEVPSHWRRWIGIDHGKGDHPSVALWIAQAAEEAEYNGYLIKKDDLFVYRELTHVGVTEEFVAQFLAYNAVEEDIEAIYADTSMWTSSKERYDSESPAYMFLRSGVNLQMANKNRVVGWSLLKTWLNIRTGEDGIRQQPRLRFFQSCQGVISELPRLKYSESSSRASQGDISSKAKDDHADALRYVCMGINVPIAEREYKEKKREDATPEPYRYKTKKKEHAFSLAARY